jgi:hypothetical protein
VTVDLKQIMLKAMDAIDDTPNMAPLKLFASGPNTEAAFREMFGDQFEIVRTDQVPE